MKSSLLLLTRVSQPPSGQKSTVINIHNLINLTPLLCEVPSLDVEADCVDIVQ